MSVDAHLKYARALSPSSHELMQVLHLKNHKQYHTDLLDLDTIAPLILHPEEQQLIRNHTVLRR